jgi:hypothetical protein
VSTRHISHVIAESGSLDPGQRLALLQFLDDDWIEAVQFRCSSGAVLAIPDQRRNVVNRIAVKR